GVGTRRDPAARTENTISSTPRGRSGTCRRPVPCTGADAGGRGAAVPRSLSAPRAVGRARTSISNCASRSAQPAGVVFGRARAAGAAAESIGQNRQAAEVMTAGIQEVESVLRRELGRVIVGADHSIRALIIALVAR